MGSTAARPFSTSVRVHPAIPVPFHQLHPRPLPKMRTPVTAGHVHLGRWILPVSGLLFVAAAATDYLDRHYTSNKPSPSAAEARERCQHTQNAALMSAYGDRESLADVQRAMELYENTRR